MIGKVAFAAGLLWATQAVAGLDVPPAVPDMSAYAMRSDLPAPADTPPPGVAVDSVTGSTTQYALANHTHATSVQRAKMTVSPAGQPVRWTFAKPYDAGIVPVVVCTAESAPGAAQPFVINTSGSATNTYVDLIVFKASTQTLSGVLTSVAGTVINLFSAAPTGTVVNCQAAKPTQ